LRNLLDFLVKYHYWFLFVLLEVVCVTLLFRYNGYQGSVWVSSANVVAGKVYEAESAVSSFFSLSKVNEQLSVRNFYLERQLAQARRLYAEATQDTTALERQQQELLGQYKLIPAKVIANTVHKADNLLTIDKGKVDGVAVDMGVACGNGVVGVVYLVSDHYSVVIPVLNVTASRISCMIRNRGYFGYLHWDGGDPTVAHVENIPRHARFKRGEWVETSGYSSIFPPGVLVGQIQKVFNSADGLSYRLQVKLTTDFSTLRDVCVISDESVAERTRLMRAAQDSIKKNKDQAN